MRAVKIMTRQPAKYRAPALDKGLDILELLARAHAPLSMTGVAAAIGYSKGEIFRMLQVLEERGYIAREHDSTRRAASAPGSGGSRPTPRSITCDRRDDTLPGT